MTTVADVADFLETFAPLQLAEDWDNVGLLVGDAEQPLRRVMTCLTITEASSGEAIERQADLIVTHHPLPFRPLNRLTAESPEGRLLLSLIAGGVAVYSAHTAMDSAPAGINQQLAEGLGLSDVKPLVTETEQGEQDLGTGRFGRFTPVLSLSDLAQRVKSFLSISAVQVVGHRDAEISSAAVGCGSAGELLEAAARAGCDALVLGETRFHTALAAEAAGVALVLSGHFASERFAVETLSDVLAKQFADLEVWASRQEQDPLWWE